MRDLQQFKSEQESELDRILAYWVTNAPDEVHGGFIGRISHSGKRYPEALKGSVLNSRILWTFSAAYRYVEKPIYLKLAERAYQYIRDYFYDATYGGTYWTVKADGRPHETRKQIYGQAFTIYGLAEYFAVSQNAEALALATEIYERMEAYSYEPEHGGYIEAFTREWEPEKDMRLGGGGENAPKTMNTHLHILEAYANLYLVWPDIRLRKSLEGLLKVFENHIIRPQTYQMVLYSDVDWRPLSDRISFGHDIEASWLLLETAEILHDEKLTQKWRTNAISMVDATFSGLAPDGSLYYEYDPVTNHWDKQRQWWVLAESVVGYLNAWQISKDERYLNQLFKVWEFTKNNILDYQGGEWFLGLKGDNTLMDGDKISLWKCPYHNSRMCLEVLKRI